MDASVERPDGKGKARRRLELVLPGVAKAKSLGLGDEFAFLPSPDRNVLAVAVLTGEDGGAAKELERLLVINAQGELLADLLPQR